MNDNKFGALNSCRLFAGISENNILSMMLCFKARTKKYNKNSVILLAGDVPNETGIVLSGEIEAYRESYDGSRLLMSRLGKSDIFAEVLASSGFKSPVTVIAKTEAEILFIRHDKMLSPCKNACATHNMLISNLLGTISGKYWELHTKIKYLTMPTLREKILEFLRDTSDKQGEPFEVPFGRDAMAEYINADRSALSRELSKMKKDGLIDYSKNTFILYPTNHNAGNILVKTGAKQ